MIEATLQTWLSEAAAVQATGARVYPIMGVPHGAAMPLITYQRISSESFAHLKGTTSLAAARIQINCTARGYAAARQLAEAVRETLDARSSGGGGSGGGGPIEVVRLISDRDAPAAASDGSNQHYFTVQQDYRVWHRRTVPSHTTL